MSLAADLMELREEDVRRHYPGALALLQGAGAPVAGAVVNFAGRSSGRRHARAAGSAQVQEVTPDWELSASGR